MHTFIKSAFAAGLAALAGTGNAQVTYMGSVPSLQALRAALAPAPAAAPATPPTGRGIEFDAPPQAAAAAAAVAGRPVPGSPAAPGCQPATGGPAVAMPINFELNSSRLAGPSAGFVDAVGRLMAQDPGLRLVIEGHTDARGDAHRNLMLSWERALAVLRTLVDKHGIDPLRLQPVGRGSLDPLEGVNPADAVNRRVQFRVGLPGPSTRDELPS